MTQTTSFTLTLTRWHHVASRIKALSKTYMDEARQGFDGNVVDSVLSQEQIEALKKRGLRAQSLLEKGLAAIATVGKIRAELARANGNHEVSAMLAEAEDKRAQARALEHFSNIDLLTMPAVDKINDILERQDESKSRYTIGRGVRVSLVPADALDFVSERRRELEAQAAAISDQVSEINRKTLTIEIDSELAKSVGL